MVKAVTLRKDASHEGFTLLGRYFIYALKGVVFIAGGLGGVVIIGILLLLALFPVFIVCSMLLKFLGF